MKLLNPNYMKISFILFVHKVSLFEKYKSYFEIIELPESRKSWFKRMYYEYSYFKNILKTKISIYGFQFMT